MRLVKNWDSCLIKYLQSCSHPKPILTAYPRAYKLVESDGQTSVRLNEGPPVAMAFKEFSPTDELPRFKARGLQTAKAQTLTRPFKALFWAAGFSFSSGKLIKECGYTDEIDDVFFGEELF